ncbi:MAG: excinuclease ABC subunit UvrA [Abditibacteriota bacterium]|nr:excinuclease ABC subunit UvrA [Abditibacteriota bacterium]
MPNDKIIIRGARQNNLKNISLEIPRDRFVVVTGLSGSGKSSIAFDTLYAEGQRKYVESLSSYARMFLGQMDKPDVDDISGLSPAVSIDQKSTSRNPRSTVGTVTEIYDYMRLLWARAGKPHCPKCGAAVSCQSIDQMVDTVLSYPEGTRLQILSPLVRGKKGRYLKQLEDLKAQGFIRVRIDGSLYDLTESTDIIPDADKNKKHDIDIIIDRLVIRPGIEKRVSESMETALKKGEGLAALDVIGSGEVLMSENFACTECGYTLTEIAPRSFSFNTPYGACPECHGLGYHKELDPALLIPNKKLSINGGAIANFPGLNGDWVRSLLNAFADKTGADLDAPVKDFTREQMDGLLYGFREPIPINYYSKSRRHAYRYNYKWSGLMGLLKKRYDTSTAEDTRELVEQYMADVPCSLCHGQRLKPDSLAVTVGDKNIIEVTDMSIDRALEWFGSLSLSERDMIIARQILREITARLRFLQDVGLGYLTLSRSAAGLSGGEAQRIRLATQIGSGLMGVLYVLDEPSIGLHQRDNRKLISALKKLRDLGNTIIVVEHDRETMESADYLIDIGPGAGEHGGRVIYAGLPGDIRDCGESLTGKYLSDELTIPVPTGRREGNGLQLELRGASANNLKHIDVDIPLGKMVCITGVSGSGKSSLVQDTLFPRLQSEVNGAARAWGKHDSLAGMEHIDKVINIDQSPIGRTPRSNTATYTGLFDMIRALFSETQDAKVRGYSPGRFSFNIKGGRCEACSGDGITRIEMHFLPDVFVPCEVCKGKRYNRETLKVRYKGKNIADVLDMTVSQALEFFDAVPRIKRKLQTIADVGLDYIRLGQPATTLSGGEAQRMKLASELSRRSTGKTLYILDEPTTGLHFHDVKKLIEVLNALVDNGNSMIIIEHNLDVIKSADYIIDMGPEGGDAGGRVICAGTPEEVAAAEDSYTGRFLREIL